LKIVATVGGSNVLSRTIEAKHQGADLIELRVDSLLSSQEKALSLAEKIKKKSKLPLIITIRSKTEGGLTGYSESDRLDFFLKFLPVADFIDIELSARKINRKLISACHRQKKGVIVSWHDFRKTPASAVLYRKAVDAEKINADIVKLAVTPMVPEDVIRLLEFCRNWTGSPLAVISMGRLGAVSRISGGLFGSCLTYGYVKFPWAEGQMNVRQLKELLSDPDT